MADITNKLTLDPAITKVYYRQLTEACFGGRKLSTVMGIWDSGIIDGENDLLEWKSVVYSGSFPDGTSMYLYVKNSDTTTFGDDWGNPFRNHSSSMAEFDKRYLKVRLVLVFTGEPLQPYGYTPQNVTGPVVDSLLIKGVASGTASKFFTKTFDLEFSPRFFLISEESDVPEQSVLRYAVTNLDSTDASEYQYVTPNEITELTELSVTGKKMKLMIEMSGSSGEEIVVHEFAFMFSGDEQKELNR